MLDLGRLTELRNEVGDEDFEEILEIFFEEVEDALNSLDLSDQKSLVAGLHFLKGCSLNIGFKSVSELCKAGEEQVRAGSIDVDLEAIRNAFLLSKAEFANHLT